MAAFRVTENSLKELLRDIQENSGNYDFGIRQGESSYFAFGAHDSGKEKSLGTWNPITSYMPKKELYQYMRGFLKSIYLHKQGVINHVSTD